MTSRLVQDNRIQEKWEKIDKAVREAHRFLDAVEALNARAVDETKDSERMLFITGCHETAALKRASMDLTIALAEMRK